MIRTLAITVIAMTAVASALDATAATARKRASGPLDLPQDGMLVGLHELRREGGRVCMVDHFHNGSSEGQPSRKAAEVAAMRAWAEFTAWEYGGHWANPAMAGSKSMRCSGSDTSWSCDFDARACRR